jgi:hypothetical protein
MRQKALRRRYGLSASAPRAYAVGDVVTLPKGHRVGMGKLRSRVLLKKAERIMDGLQSVRIRAQTIRASCTISKATSRGFATQQEAESFVHHAGGYPSEGGHPVLLEFHVPRAPAERTAAERLVAQLQSQQGTVIDGAVRVLGPNHFKSYRSILLKAALAAGWERESFEQELRRGEIEVVSEIAGYVGHTNPILEYIIHPGLVL